MSDLRKGKAYKVGVFADMASPVRSALEHKGIKTLKQLSKYAKKEILNIHGIGPSSILCLRKN